MKKVIIAGGGASGIMAAIWSARAGARVTVLENERKPLKKLLRTGNGRCNLTNLKWDRSVLRGSDIDKAYRIINNFNHNKTIAFFAEIGVYTKNRDGWVYPLNDSAASVAGHLLNEAEKLKVKIKNNQTVRKIERCNNSFKIYTQDWEYDADSVIISCGSPSGTEDVPCQIAAETAGKFNISFHDFLPAITALKSFGSNALKWSGVRVNGSVDLYIDNVSVDVRSGELQLLPDGISGIPIYELSRYAVKALSLMKNVCLIINFLPSFSERKLNDEFFKLKSLFPKASDAFILSGFIPEKLASHIMSLCKDLDSAAVMVRGYRLEIDGYSDFSKAQASMGGVDLNDLTDDLEAKNCSGLFFCGEAADIDGSCGGYNLQWAWSSAYAVGTAQLKRKAYVED